MRTSLPQPVTSRNDFKGEDFDSNPDYFSILSFHDVYTKSRRVLFKLWCDSFPVPSLGITLGFIEPCRQHSKLNKSTVRLEISAQTFSDSESFKGIKRSLFLNLNSMFAWGSSRNQVSAEAELILCLKQMCPEQVVEDYKSICQPAML